MAVPVILSVTSGSDAGTSHTAPMPATRPDGDLYMLCFFQDGTLNATIPSPEADHWTEIIYHDHSAVNDCGVAVWWWYGSSEPASYTITTAVNENAHSTVLRISGAHATVPIDVSGSTDGDSDPAVAPAVVTTVGDTLVIRVAASDIENVTYTTFDDTEVDIGSTGTTAGHIAYGCTEKDQAAIGTTGAGDFDHSSAAAEQWVAATIAISPAASASDILTINSVTVGNVKTANSVISDNVKTLNSIVY